MKRFQHGAIGSPVSAGTGKVTTGLSQGCDEPSPVQGKADDSCSTDWWSDLISEPVEVASAHEGTCTFDHKELEAPLVPIPGSTDVWVVDQALAEAISGGLSCSRARFPELCIRTVKESWHWGLN